MEFKNSGDMNELMSEWMHDLIRDNEKTWFKDVTVQTSGENFHHPFAYVTATVIVPLNREQLKAAFDAMSGAQ